MAMLRQTLTGFVVTNEDPSTACVPYPAIPKSICEHWPKRRYPIISTSAAFRITDTVVKYQDICLDCGKEFR